MYQAWFLETISLLSDIIVGLSALTVAILGIYGFNQWRRELKGRARFELARKMASLAYQFRDEFKRARDPFTFPGESSDRMKGDNENPEVSQVLDEYFARRQRLRPLQETLRKLIETSWEGGVILNEEIQKKLVPFEDTFRKFFVAIEAHFYTQRRLAERRGIVLESSESDELDWERQRSARQMVYGPADDEVSQSVDAVVERFVTELRAYIK